MTTVAGKSSTTHATEWVQETRFGKWFISTDIWIDYVLREAIADFHNMMGERLPQRPVMLDVGCGIGLSFAPLDEMFQPQLIIGADIDQASLQKARHTALHTTVLTARKTARHAARPPRCELRLLHSPAQRLELPDASVDIVFCHQLLHHVTAQHSVLRELHRVLRPGGFLLSGESCRSFIHSFWVRLLFRHPNMLQKSAEEYVELIRAAGFEVAQRDVRCTVPWWSRVDFGLLERLGLSSRRPATTEVNTVAIKPV